MTAISSDERVLVDSMPLVRASLHAAHRLGRLYGRHETLVAAARAVADVTAIQAQLDSVYGVADDQTLVVDGPPLMAVKGDAA